MRTLGGFSDTGMVLHSSFMQIFSLNSFQIEGQNPDLLRSEFFVTWIENL